MKDLVFFGIQGSGKGTQAKKLAAKFGFDIFEAGGELRKIVAQASAKPAGEDGSGSELGKTVASYINAGNLVPHQIIMQVVKEAIAARPKTQRILFDGIPRDTDQMNDFDTIMREAGRDFFGIQLLLSEQKAIERILGRAKQEGRVDDADDAVIRKRIHTFTTKTVPVIDAYAASGKLVTVEGDRGMDEVYADLEKILSSHS
jgi:adenylate kinase